MDLVARVEFLGGLEGAQRLEKRLEKHNVLVPGDGKDAAARSVERQVGHFEPDGAPLLVNVELFGICNVQFLGGKEAYNKRLTVEGVACGLFLCDALAIFAQHGETPFEFLCRGSQKVYKHMSGKRDNESCSMESVDVHWTDKWAWARARASSSLS